MPAKSLAGAVSIEHGVDLVLLMLLAGCRTRFLEDEVDGARHLWTRLSPSVGGTAIAKIPVLDDETAMIATVTVDAPNVVHVRAVRAPGPNEVFRAFEWNDSAYSKTNAGFVADVVTLNWPIQADDTPLSGGKWELEFGVVDANSQYTSSPLFLDVLLKRDAAFSFGALDVSIVFTDGLEDDTTLRAAVNDAKALWAELYDGVGIELRFEEFAFQETGLLAPAFGTETAYVNIAEDTPPRAVNLIISEQIAGLADIFGIAGDIPGPYLASTRSAVQVSALLAAGPDGRFDAEDTRLFAETMAHEVAHYLGLFHPVETGWDGWDVLNDTQECGTEADCIDELGRNLMFPFPVCGPAFCTPQDELTDAQTGVVHRNVGVK